jgi:hypothetical protein
VRRLVWLLQLLVLLLLQWGCLQGRVRRQQRRLRRCGMACLAGTGMR